MARGWESKAVEAQQQDHQESSAQREPASAGERAAMEQRRTLELARARTLADLEASTSPVYRSMLEQALKAIEERIDALTPGD
jgi:hypothetical protein